MLSHLESGSEGLRRFYSPFFLTGFFFLSGYVYKQPSSFKNHMSKKIKALFIPWLLFSNLNIFLSMIITLKGERNLIEEIFWNTLQIRGIGDGLWFLSALFVAFIPFYFLINWGKPKKACIVSALLSMVSMVYTNIMNPDLLPWHNVALPWHLEYMFQAMFWMTLGYYFKIYGENILDKLNTTKNSGMIWLLYLMTVYINVNFWWLMIPLTYIRSILGIVSLVLVCKRIKASKYIRFVGANTLTYFALHGKILAVIEMLVKRVFGKFYLICLGNALMSNVLAILLTIVISIILIIPTMGINKFLPWSVGRRRNTI